MQSRKDLVSVIGERTMKVTDKQVLAKAVAAYLSEEHRSLDLNSLTRDVMQYRVERGIVEAVAVSAHELTPLVIKDIEDLLRHHFPAAKKIIVNTRIDEDVIGGVRLEMPQESLDLSVKSKLNTFKRLVAEERN